MITQNPIVGRSRNKLAGVYARTLWGKNVIQSCPGPSQVPPTRALRDSRAAFRVVQLMANMFPASLLNDIFYTAPVGRSRRIAFTSQIFSGVLRNDMIISFDESAIAEIGSNAISSTASVSFTATTKSFRLPKSTFPATTIADTTRIPLIIAASYQLAVCVSWLPYTSLDGDDILIENISDSFIGNAVQLFCLWPVNIGTTQTPVWAYGRFKKDPESD